MATDNSQILNDLKRLHEELEKSGPVDEELRGLLQQLDNDIDRLLKNSDDGEEEGLLESVETQMEEIAVGFEARHPQINAFLREVAAALGRMGI